MQTSSTWCMHPKLIWCVVEGCAKFAKTARLSQCAAKPIDDARLCSEPLGRYSTRSAHGRDVRRLALFF